MIISDFKIVKMCEGLDAWGKKFNPFFSFDLKMEESTFEEEMEETQRLDRDLLFINGDMLDDMKHKDVVAFEDDNGVIDSVFNSYDLLNKMPFGGFNRIIIVDGDDLKNKLSFYSSAFDYVAPMSYVHGETPPSWQKSFYYGKIRENKTISPRLNQRTFKINCKNYVIPGSEFMGIPTMGQEVRIDELTARNLIGQLAQTDNPYYVTKNEGESDDSWVSRFVQNVGESYPDTLFILISSLEENEEPIRGDDLTRRTEGEGGPKNVFILKTNKESLSQILIVQLYIRLYGFITKDVYLWSCRHYKQSRFYDYSHILEKLTQSYISPIFVVAKVGEDDEEDLLRLAFLSGFDYEEKDMGRERELNIEEFRREYEERMGWPIPKEKEEEEEESVEYKGKEKEREKGTK